jgi:hypothetical protein
MLGVSVIITNRAAFLTPPMSLNGARSFTGDSCGHDLLYL